MTLDDAINYYDGIAKECRANADIERNDYMDLKDNAAEAEQLASWLNELKLLRERIEKQPEPCDDPRADVYYLAEKIGIHRLYALVVELRGEPEPCKDAVSRQAAADVVDFECGEWRGLAKTIINKIEALPSAQPDNQIHLCDSCEYDYPECPCKQNDVIFGNGKGNDNICACNKYKPSAQPEREHTMEEFMYGQDMGNPEDGSL